ncbi:MAG: glycosyltransferase [Phycisphaeraceae bacterium]|nr:glycosyltransferase [Phycisphaeraceae bacterium]
MLNGLATASQWWTQPEVRWPLTALYILVMAVVSVYGMHRYWLVLQYVRHRRQWPRIKQWFTELPVVTVQLPLFNEPEVVERVIDAVCRLDYPWKKLQIQVLDDSTDRTTELAAAKVQQWQRRGLDIELHHRTNRQGFKAGALSEAMPRARGQFIAIFDADFVPDPDFLRRTIHYFTDSRIGLVQARWGHLNRDDSALTRAQAIFLDAHFLIEHGARCRSDCWINFNGTAGIWRREAIDTAGGWQTDTLTEDVDLSYRSQLAGWRFLFVPRVICPAELPPEMNAFKSQQHRWTKGSIQTARKLLWRLLRSQAPWRVKFEAFFHLTSVTVCLFVTLMVLLFYPTFRVNLEPFAPGTSQALLWGIGLFALGTMSATTFYLASQKVQNRGILRTLLQVPVLMSIGIGISLNNGRAVLEALFGHESPFERTPKFSATSPVAAEAAPARKRRFAAPRGVGKWWMIALELAMCAYCLWCASLSLEQARTMPSLPFLLLFAAGYGYVGLSSLAGMCRALWRRPAAVVGQPG